MPDMDEREAALEAFDRGVPSTLPDTNRYKPVVEAHRWGQHRSPRMGCPVCVRGGGRRKADDPISRIIDGGV